MESSARLTGITPVIASKDMTSSGNRPEKQVLELSSRVVRARNSPPYQILHIQRLHLVVRVKERKR